METYRTRDSFNTDAYELTTRRRYDNYYPESKTGWGLFTWRRNRNRASAVTEEIIHHQLQELDYLRDQLKKQEGRLQDMHGQLRERENDTMDQQERWNMLDFKYHLLIDMWAMRVLDNEAVATERRE
eukprot:jgi/Botrbrau1/12739/Bobra.67_1s0098.1